MTLADRLRPFVALCALCLALDGFAGVDALKARIVTDDADRFAHVFRESGGAPDAAQLQAGYLDNAGRGVEVFLPDRIRDADNLARAIMENPADYVRALEVCLPLAKASNDELRAVYLAFDGLLDDPELPEIHVVFGAGTSGGTAVPGIQVIGLEVICRIAETEDEIRGTYRTFFAHETVHALQPTIDEDEALAADVLLLASLREGAADFIAWLVTGIMPNAERDSWAKAREAAIWVEFQRDRAIIGELEGLGKIIAPSPYKRWLGNAFSAPEGWPSELGYWVGMQICRAYFEQAEDKRQALLDLLALTDPQAILDASGYSPLP